MQNTNTPEQLEINVQASRHGFKSGAELNGKMVRHVDVTVDESNDEDKSVFTMNLKITYENTLSE